MVCIDSGGELRDLFEGGPEDALRVSIFGVCQEFNIIRLNRKPCLSNKVLVDCVESPCNEFGSCCGMVELGIAVLVGLVEIRCCTLDRGSSTRFVKYSNGPNTMSE